MIRLILRLCVVFAFTSCQSVFAKSLPLLGDEDFSKDVANVSVIVSGSDSRGSEVQPSSPINTSTIYSGDWVVLSINGTGLKTRPTLQFGGNRIFGTAPCNRFSANFSKSPAGLKFVAVSVTKKICAPEVMADEENFLNLLRKVKGAYIVNGHMVCVAKSEEYILLSPR